MKETGTPKFKERYKGELIGYLPQRDDEIYNEIEKFQDYELKNNLIFELLLRTKEYANLQEMGRDARIKAAKSLGFSVDNAKYAGLLSRAELK